LHLSHTGFLFELRDPTCANHVPLKLGDETNENTDEV